MPRVTINGVEHDFPQGIKVIEACRTVGVYVPHFCYHPSLSVVGSCRMCKVEVIQDGKSRIDISCRLEVAEGMEVLTASEAVGKQQQMTLEYLLANHPLDCPICDDAGECDLQDYYLKFGRHTSRTREGKIRKRKATDIGKSVVLDNERCVLCSRCARFTSEITRTHELGIFGMGAREELMLRPGARLDNDYSGNVVDLCPVGALTDKDFRFKRRVWYLRMTPSVCQLCSRGCSVRIDHDTNPFHAHKQHQLMRTHRTPTTDFQRIQRVKPRLNPNVNGHWICDHGRYGYKDTDDGSRLATALKREAGGLEALETAAAAKAFGDAVLSALKGGGKIAVVISPRVTLEEAFALKALFRDKLNVHHIDHRLPINPDWRGDDLLRTPDPYPNRTGCEWLRLTPSDGGVGVDGLNDAVLQGRVDTVVTALCEPADFLTPSAVKKLKQRLVIARNLTESMAADADVILPAAAWSEYRGTYVNFQGRIQRLEAAFEPLGMSKPIWQIALDLGALMKKPLSWQTLDSLWHALSEEIHFLKGLNLDAIGPEGLTVGTQKLRATA